MENSVRELSCTVNVPRQTGTFTFRIGGFPALEERVGETTESPEFDLCRRKWQLRIFPGGSLVAHTGYVSYYLASKSTVNTRASYKLSIINQHGGEDEVFQSTGIRKFEAKGESIDGWGRDKFIERSTLLSPRSGLCVDDTVIFRVEMTVYFNSGATDGAPHITIFPKNSNRVMDDFSKALGDDSYSDLTLRVVRGNDSDYNAWRSGGRETSDCDECGEDCEAIIRCHRFVLCARSPVFRAMLTNGMQEQSTSLINICDVEPNAMKELVRFMYTDHCECQSVLDDTASLLAAASKYQVEGLMEYCEEVICSCMNVSSVIDILVLADAYAVPDLKKHCVAFIIKHAHDIMLKGTIAELEFSLRQEVLQSIQEAILNCRGDFHIEDVKKHNACVIL